MNRIGSPAAFDYGLERVSEDWVAGNHLPDKSVGVSPLDRPENALNELLFPRTIEQTVLAALRPDIRHQELLTPHGFAEAQRQAMDEIGNAIQTENDVDRKQKLMELDELLQANAELHALVSSYRHLLHQA